METTLMIIAALVAGILAMLPVVIMLQRQLKELRAAENELQQSLNAESVNLAKKEAECAALQQKLDEQKTEITELHKRLNTEFELMANKILDEKSDRLSKNNLDKLAELLNPLKERITQFEKKVDEAYNSETREKAGLRKELEQIIRTNMQMSEDARRLTVALKGDGKTQGDWGEMQLELILQKVGLEPDVHYVKQQSLRNESGDVLRPDFVINLPEGKNFIIDSKVSLTAYEKYCSAETDAEKEHFLSEHLQSLNRHIQQLGQKNYQQLYGINSPDFVFLFVAVEPALLLALQHDRRIFDRALSNNIVLVSATTLLATMRTVSFIWRQEKQKNNVLAIANESGKLYDKFVGFAEDLNKIGRSIDNAAGAYKAAMNKMCDSTKYGDTIMGRMENLKKLGANTAKDSKNISSNIQQNS